MPPSIDADPPHKVPSGILHQAEALEKKECLLLSELRQRSAKSADPSLAIALRPPPAAPKRLACARRAGRWPRQRDAPPFRLAHV